MKNLTFEKLMIARVKILQNSKDLIVDSEILLDNKRYPRAYTLSHLASEELTKLITMHGICLDVLSGDAMNWNKVEKKLRDHKYKIKRSFEFDLFCTLASDDEKYLKQFEEGLELVDSYNIMKNASIYAGMLENSFCTPVEVISERLARKMVQISKNRYEWFHASENAFSKLIASDGGKQKALENWKDFCAKMKC